MFRCPPGRIDEVLALVGLSGTGRKRVDQFSLGMKQRLSIAVALLHEPALLVLDEPTNGLDPHGILEVRDLLGRLNREHGMTVLVSSHILSEIEKLVSHVGIIHRGAMVFQGTLAALVAQTKAPAPMEDAYTRVVNVDPFDSAAQSALGRLLMQRRDTNGAVRAFRSALASKPADPAVAHLELAEAYMGVGNRVEAKAETLQALEIAPSFERAQDLLLKLVDGAEK